MSRNKKINFVTAKIFTTGLIILAGCMIACIVHMNSVQRIFRQKAEEELLGHMQVAVAVVNNDIDAQREVTVACAETIERNYGKKPLRYILKEYSDEYDEYEFYYAAPNEVTYYANGRELRDGAFEQLSQIRSYEFHNNFICITQEGNNVKGEKDSYWIGICRLQLEGYDEPGFLMSRRCNKDLFKDECFDYLGELGVCGIIDKWGTVVTTDTNYVKELGLDDDFYEALLKYSNGSSYSESQIVHMRGEIPAKQEGTIEITSSKGRNVFVAYEEILGTRDRYLVVVFHEDAIYQMIQPVLFRNFLLWTIILHVMLITIALVWNSGRVARRTVERLAFEDSITGGKNLNFFRKKAAEIMNQHREYPFLIYRFDILNFRYINEAYGHKKADAILKACIEEFQNVWSKDELCVRINSDQFLALLINNTQTNQKYQSYIKALGEAARANGVRYPIRLCTGIYQVRKDDYDLDIMIDHANAARKSIKGTDKIPEAVYSEKLISNMKRINAIESQMQPAIIHDEYKIYLQPKWDIEKDCLIGAEALVRWIKEDGTVIFPSDFIPLFETNGFIEKLDFYMLEKLCKQIQFLEEQGEYQLVPISVNQSRILINNPDYVKNVEKVISRYNIDVKYLEIEITETVFFDEKNKMVEVVNQLKNLGLHLAMDDFGSGYSSLNILRDIPFDVLKIDRGFVNESVTSESSIIIMQKIIEMAKGLNIEVICEGVETKEQVETLRNLGCTQVQGYYYGKPMPMEEFLEKFCKKEA